MSYKVDSAPAHDLDKVIYATIARMTSGLSPASLVNAYVDWLIHLSFSPGKQHELSVKAGTKARKMLAHLIQSVWQPCETCIDPLPQDTRFAAPEWRQMPYLAIYQTFLLQQQWWHNATTDVPGVNHHHERVLDFTSRQMLDLVSPSNFSGPTPRSCAARWTEVDSTCWRARAIGGKTWCAGCRTKPPSARTTFVPDMRWR